MRINVASKNPVKIKAVRELLAQNALFLKAEINSLDVSPNVSEQPKSLEETINGAINRAKAAFRDCDYSFGIEAGIMPVPQTKTGYMNFCVCAIYDGRQCHLGLSGAFEFPIKVTKIILERGVDANEAFYLSGLTEKRKIGSEEGIIGFLTKGKLMRKEYTKQAIQMALVHLENPELY